MKVFISWSGELSKKVADEINKWLPCLLQTVKIFYSPEDIEKGENWDQRISAELSDCNYGLICLTQENVSAPWINFEAGAIAKALDSRVAALMININPSDIKGPLSRYQATKLEKEDFFHLIQNINNNSDSSIEEMRLKTTFDGLWSNIEEELTSIIKSTSSSTKSGKKVNERTNSEAIEEILQVVRKQYSILSSPELLLPREYIEYVVENTLPTSTELIKELLSYLDFLYDRLRDSDASYVLFVQSNLQIMDFIQLIGKNIPKRNRSLYGHYADIRRRFALLYDSFSELRSPND